MSTGSDAAARVRWSLLRASAAQRLCAALAALASVWAVVWWAL
jgi:hypothetical protein